MADMKLRECPFCEDGGRAHIQTAFPDNVICAKCGCATWLKTWNTRASDSTIEAQEAEIKRLRSVINDISYQLSYPKHGADYIIEQIDSIVEKALKEKE